VEEFQDIRTGKIHRMYMGFKKQRPRLVLFFDHGRGFFEAYFGDALLLSKHLGADLDFYEGIPICRMNRAMAKAYIERLTTDQWEVGICERDEDIPDEAKKILEISI